MRDLDSVLTDLDFWMSKRQHLQEELNDLGRKGLSPAVADEARQMLQQQLSDVRVRCIHVLEEMLAFSPHHLRHKAQLETFWQTSAYDTSVFLMTKFPRSDSAASEVDAELQKVLDVISAAVEEAGFQPRIARGVQYHPLLWDNVELHLLGCRRGIAIVEDRYLPELNPNVAMEWGWMRAMAKPVLFLVEKGFTRLRADLEGFLKADFSWEDPEPGICAAVSAFLKGTPVP